MIAVNHCSFPLSRDKGCIYKAACCRTRISLISLVFDRQLSSNMFASRNH